VLTQNFSKFFESLISRKGKTLTDIFGVERDVFFDNYQKFDFIVLMGTDTENESYFEMTNLFSPISYAENVPDSFQNIWNASNKEIVIGSISEWSGGRLSQDYVISELGLILWHEKFESFEYYSPGVSEITGYKLILEGLESGTAYGQVVAERPYEGSNSYKIFSRNGGYVVFKIPNLIKQESVSFSIYSYTGSADLADGLAFDLYFKGGERHTVWYRDTSCRKPSNVLSVGSSSYTIVDYANLFDKRTTDTIYLRDVCNNSPYPYEDLEKFDFMFWVESYLDYDAYLNIDGLKFRLPFLIGRLSVADGTLNSFTIDKTKSLKLTYEIRAE